MSQTSHPMEAMPPETRAFYVRAMTVLQRSGVPFLVGGAYALRPVAGIERQTKDLDLFLRPEDRDRALEVFRAHGYRTEIPFPHWLAKAYPADAQAPFIDLVYRSGNGLAEVDDGWFNHAAEAEVLGLPVRLTPPEESLWSKAFVMERERFDGADVVHILRSVGPELDWDRLVRRFGEHWRVLLAHLVLFGYIYPAEREKIPADVLRHLTNRMRCELRTRAPEEPICRGTFLSRQQYLVDVERDGLADARIEPLGPMTADDVALWTDAIARDGSTA